MLKKTASKGNGKKARRSGKFETANMRTSHTSVKLETNKRGKQIRKEKDQELIKGNSVFAAGGEKGKSEGRQKINDCDGRATWPRRGKIRGAKENGRGGPYTYQPKGRGGGEKSRLEGLYFRGGNCQWKNHRRGDLICEGSLIEGGKNKGAEEERESRGIGTFENLEGEKELSQRLDHVERSGRKGKDRGKGKRKTLKKESKGQTREGNRKREFRF